MNTIDFIYGSKRYKVAEPGFLGAIVGESGSGKTSITEPLTTSAISGQKKSGWDVKLDNKKVCVVDTESPRSLEERYKLRIKESSGLSSKEFNNNFHYFNLSYDLSFERRVSQLETIIEESFDLIILDNLTGLCSPIDGDSATYIFNLLSKKAIENNSIVLALNHLNQRGTSRGWLGTKFKEQGSFQFFLEKNIQWGYTLVKPEKTRLDKVPMWDFSIPNQDTKEIILGPVIPFPV